MEPIASFSGLASGLQWRDMIDQIMKIESSRRLTPVTQRVQLQTNRKTAWSDFSSLVTKLRDASKAFSDGSTFGAYKTSVSESASGRALVSASATSEATPGKYEIEVLQLAQAEKLGSAEIADTAAALNLAGTFQINGRSVTLASGDSLTALRDKINAVNTGSNASGVTATILSTSSNSHRLILTAEDTGSRGIELVDSTNGVLKSATLGVLGGTQVQNSSPTNAAWTDSRRATSASNTLEAALGVTPPPQVTTVRIGGKQITVDFANDTLISLQNKIIAAGVSSEVKEEVIDGRTQYRLSVNGTVTADASAGDPANSQRVAELLGFVKNSSASQIAAGRDAQALIDGYAVTRRGNTITDAIQGVTLDLLATDAAARTSSATGGKLGIAKDPGTIPAGTYAVNLTTSVESVRTAETSNANLKVAYDPGVANGTYAVEFTTATTRTSRTSDGSNLTVVDHFDPDTQAGTYDVNITALAASGKTTGTANAGAYTGVVGDYFRIRDEVSGIERDYVIGVGESLTSVVSGLNNMFTSNGMNVRATNDGGKLKLEHTKVGSTEGFRLNTNNGRVNTHYGVTNATYVGTNIQGTIGGQPAVGTGTTLRSSTGAAKDLQVRYAGTTTGIIGNVTVTDTQNITGGKIGNEAATWDAATKTLTANAGTALASLKVEYTGAAMAGTVGNVVVSTGTKEVVTGVTIGGEAATWDSATSTIKGGAGTRFAGLELSHTGTVTSGKAGDFVVSGDIAVDLEIARDTEATKEQVKGFVDAYNAVANFVKKQRDTQGPLYANGSVRSMLGSLRDVMFTDVAGLSTGNTYTRPSLAGVQFTRDGVLELDEETFDAAVATNLSDLEELFGGIGTLMEDVSDGMADSLDGTIKLQQDALGSSISTLEQRQLDIEAALERQRASLVQQFTAMEDAMSRIQSQGNWLASQLSSLSPR